MIKYYEKNKKRFSNTTAETDRRMKRFFTLFLALALTFTALALCGCSSCSETAQDVLARADAALSEAPYKVVLKMEYESDNAEVAEVLSAMNVEIPTVIDGDKMSMNMAMDMGDYVVYTKRAVVDKVLYYSVSLNGETTNMKAALTDEQNKSLVGENSAELVVGAKDFGELTLEKKAGEKHVICSQISEQGIEKLDAMMEYATLGFDAEISFSDVDCYMIIRDGKYDYMEVECVYSVIIDGESYTVTMSMSAALYYDNIDPITVPANADEYETVDYEDIMG